MEAVGGAVGGRTDETMTTATVMAATLYCNTTVANADTLHKLSATSQLAVSRKANGISSAAVRVFKL